MFVLHVHDRWSARGGADWHLLTLLDSLPKGVRAAGLFGRADGSVEAAPPLAGGLDFLPKLDRQAPFAAEVRVGRELATRIARIGPDLIHVHNILNPVLMTTLAEHGPAVISVQDHRFFCPGRGKVRADETVCERHYGRNCRACFDEELYFDRLMALVEARLAALKNFSAVIVLSRYMREELLKVGLAPDKVHVIPPFVHGLRPVDDVVSGPEYVLFAGRVVWVKGIFDFLEILAGLRGRVRGLLAGAGTIGEHVDRRIRALGLEADIDDLGWVTHREMAAVFARSRMLVMPSRWREPFGIVGLEALAMGRPVVAYDVGGVRDWLETGRTGLIVPAGDIEALAAAIRCLLDDPDRAGEMGRAGREAAARFAPRVLMERLVELYQRLDPV